MSAALPESPPTMALKTIMQMQTFPGDFPRKGGIGGARVKGGELQCGRQADCGEGCAFQHCSRRCISERTAAAGLL